MTYNAYTSINSLEEFSIVAGNDFLLTFNTYQDDGITPLTITGYTVNWVLSPFGQPDLTVLQKSGVLSGTTAFTVHLLTADTESLSGKYVYQPVLTSGATTYKPAQGCIFIQPQITVA